MADHPQIKSELPENAYRELKPGEEYVPMVPPGVTAPELTLRSVVFGIVMNILFAVAATYLALKVGQGIETAIPISILSVGLSGFLLKLGMRRSTIIENINILAISTTSGMVAGGTVFTMPAIYLLKLNEHLDLSTGMVFLHIASIPFLGAIFGVIFLVPFRRYFVKEMHGKLPFPEGTATNEILVTGQTGGKNAWILVYSFIVAAIYTIGTTAFKLWTETFTTGRIHVGWKEKAEAAGEVVEKAITPLAFEGGLIETFTTKVKAIFSMGTGAEFLGLGFIIGIRYASIIMAGSFLSFFVIVPLLAPLDIDALQLLNPTMIAHKGALEKEARFNIPSTLTAQLDELAEVSKKPKDEEMPEAKEAREARVKELNGEIAALFAANNCGILDVDGAVLTAKKKDGEWRFRDTKQTWVIKAGQESHAVFALVPTGGEIFGRIPKNIGIGCIFMAGLLSILKMSKVIVTALREALGSLFRKSEVAASQDRTDEDISYPLLGLLGIVTTVVVALYFRFFVLHTMDNPNFLTLASVLIALVIAFIFITVSAWAIATISVTPISGMTVTTIIITAVALMACGLEKGPAGQLAVLLVGGVVASALSVAGTLVTEFKLGYWAGSSPKRIQWSCIIACLLASVVVTGTIMLLAESRGFDPEVSANALEAPQANLMKSALDSFLGQGEVPWLPYGVGVVLALLLELVGISPLAFGLGMYLPMSLNAPILVGALVSAGVKRGHVNQETKKARNDKGIIIASGLIAGAAIVGVGLNGLSSWSLTEPFIGVLDIPARLIAAADDPAAAAVGIGRMFNWFGLLAFLGLCGFIYWDSRKATAPPTGG